MLNAVFRCFWGNKWWYLWRPFDPKSVDTYSQLMLPFIHRFRAVTILWEKDGTFLLVEFVFSVVRRGGKVSFSESGHFFEVGKLLPGCIRIVSAE